MSGVVLAVVILAGVMAATIVVATLVLRRVGDRAERRADALRGEVRARGEHWVVPLAGAEYRGGGHPPGHSKGRGVLGLTDRRLVFLPIAGDRLSVPRARVTGVCIEDRRRDATSEHRHHLVLTLDDASRLSFLVDDAAVWTAALAADVSPVD